MLPTIALLALAAFSAVDATPIPGPATLARRMNPDVADKSIFFKPTGPSCDDLKQELQDHGLMAALCAISKLNPNWLRRLVNSGEALDGQNDELRIKMWRDDQQDESKWLEPILVETEQVVKFEEAMAMKSVDGLGWWVVGSTHNGAKSTETGWWPAAFEKALLQVGFPERTPDGEYAVMGNHRGLAAITGYPVMSYNVNWEGTADGDKQYSQNGYWDIFGKADYTPVLIETRASCNHLASGYVYTVMTTRTADNGDRMVTLFMAWYTETKEYKVDDIMGDLERVTFLKDFPALITP